MSDTLNGISLSGVHILVTRPYTQAVTWCDKLISLGAETSIAPVLDIAPVAESSREALQARALIQRLNEYTWVIFVSQNAVKAGVDWIDRFWPALPMGVGFLGIGPATEHAMAQADLPVVESTHQTTFTSEALLASPVLHSVEGQKILIIRGLGGRTCLGDTLSERGASVDYGELYQRLMPKTFDIDPTFINDTQNLRIMTAHSGDSVNNLVALVAPDQRPWVLQQPLLVPGQRVALMAQELGFSQVLVATNATSDSMIEAIYEWQKNR